MLSLLRQTKLFVPPLRPELVPRPRLLARLDQAREPGSRAIVIAAPAGFGKTTLAAQWLSQQPWPVSWLSLDEHDNHPARFLRYLAAAFQRCVPAVGSATESLLTLPQPDVEEVVTAIANAVADSPRGAALVLDDYHEIRELAVHQAVRSLLGALPPQARLVVLSREDPPLPIARLYARGQLVEVRSDELRFTAAEAASFLNDVMRLGLTADQVRELEARTEGWIAGLQLAALSLRTAADRSAFVDAFSGSQRSVISFLVEEVLDRQTDAQQAFLLRTSVLDRLSGPLCDALLESERGAGAATLAQLERRNLFLIPLDETGTWYRYHRLFADLLRARLAFAHAEIVPTLHRRASLWLEAHDDPKAAFDHAAAAGDFGRAGDIVERAITDRWRETDLNFFQAIDQLPDDVLRARPSLCLLAAWLHVMAGRVERVPELVAAAEHHLLPAPAAPPSADGGLLAFASVLRAYVDDFAGRTPSLLPPLERSVDAVPAAEVGMRNSIAVVLGSLHCSEGQFDAAARCFRDAIERDRRASGTNAIPVAAARWARMLIVQGRLREAEQLCREHAAYVGERGARRFNVAGSLNLVLGEVLRERNRLPAAEAQIREGLSLNERWPIPQAQLSGLTVLARLQIARGDWQEAEATIGRSTDITRQYQIHPEFLSGLEAVRVRLLAARQRTAELEAWLRHDSAGEPPTLTFRHEVRHIARARALLALGQPDRARELLQRLRASAERGGRSGHLIEILALLGSCSPGEQALSVLGAALRLAEPEGYVRCFVEVPALQPALAELRQRLARGGDGRLAAYARALLTAFAAEPRSAVSEAGQGLPGGEPRELAEPLTQREREVLQLVAAGLTNQQIADRLIISLRTVKKHVENVYGKLAVESRVQAVARARELQIL